MPDVTGSASPAWLTCQPTSTKTPASRSVTAVLVASVLHGAGLVYGDAHVEPAQRRATCVISTVPCTHTLS
jgi:hypothetical protein